MYHCYTCCDRSSHSDEVYVKGCTGMFDSCGRNYKEEIGYTYYHECCGNIQGIGMGCIEKCSNCKNSLKNEGCIPKSFYLCCREGENSIGCNEKWTCCGTDVRFTASGCSISCCKRAPGSEGCKQQYSCCKQLVDECKEGCKNQWSCCSNLKNSEGCKLKWKCCNAIVSITNPNDKEKACKQICKSCEGEWGKSPGCCQEEHEFK